MKEKSKSSVPEPQTGIESIETGIALLLCFVTLGGRSHQLKALAAVAGMPPSKAHRYLVSLIRTGLVERNSTNGQYQLGPKSIELGAAALDAMDAVAASVEAMVALRGELEDTTVLTVWGSSQPVIVRVEEANRLMTVGFRVGKSLPLLRSATGLLFSAFLPAATVEPLLRAEVQANKKAGEGIRTMAEAEELVADARARRMARIVGTITTGINAIAAPVFDQRGYPATVISAVGPAQNFDIGWNGAVATALRRHTDLLSRRLGSKGPSTLGVRVAEKPARADTGTGLARRARPV